MHVLALSLGRTILERDSRERARMRVYAEALESYHIIVLTRREHGFVEDIHEGDLHLYPTNSRSRFMMLIDAYRIARRLSLGAPGVVTAQDPLLIGFVSLLIARAKRARFHVQLHGDYFDSPFWHQGSPVKLFELWLARRIMHRACGIRVVSERIKRSLIGVGIESDRITVLPIRPELEKFLTVPREVRTSDSLNLLVMSRFSPEKNIPMMLRAFANVCGQHPNIRLRLCGRGSEERKIRALIASLHIESFVDVISWTEHPEREYANADIFLLGSDHEAYGLTLIEALAAGLPVITTDVGCVGEVLKDGIHGLVVQPRDETAYTHAIERMATDAVFRERCGTAGKATAHMLGEVSEAEYIKAWVAALSCLHKAV